MLDIDHFKQVNDTYGHLAGDQVLVEVARRISGSLRRVDFVCRYGGEEFAVILPETNLFLAEQVADRIWSKITSNPFTVVEKEIPIGISLGVAYKDSEDDMSIETLLDLADQALYKAKNAGRNQVKSYSKLPASKAGG
jgi:diguanylate cyclase (GGDEF)-like protein